MKAIPLSLLAALLLVRAAHAQDPVQTDGDKYRVLLENEQVRVLQYTDQPGEKTHAHGHPAFVLYALAPFRRTLTLADGRVVSREFKAGDVLYSPGEAHTGENTGGTPTQVLIVELKGGPVPKKTGPQAGP
ncbi:MAG TPA: hypothetical protein VK195_05375 [Burkholderiaceae bacterium]|nr:hypothetical protein [Burkholderiaceae bacterium]